MEMEDMKNLMNIFIQSDFRPLTGLKAEAEKHEKKKVSFYNNLKRWIDYTR